MDFHSFPKLPSPGWEVCHPPPKVMRRPNPPVSLASGPSADVRGLDIAEARAGLVDLNEHGERVSDQHTLTCSQEYLNYSGTAKSGPPNVYSPRVESAVSVPNIAVAKRKNY